MTAKTIILLAGALASYSLLAAPVDWSKLPPPAKQADVTFAKDIQPMFKESCVRCHGAERPKAQLRLDSLAGVLKGAKRGPVVKPGDSADSVLVKAISQLDPKMAMPPKPRGHRGPGGSFGHPPGQAGEPNMAGHEGENAPPPHGPQGTNGPGMRPPHFGPPPKPLTAAQVGLVRAWIDQGAK
jgi:hypothetical protein